MKIHLQSFGDCHMVYIDGALSGRFIVQRVIEDAHEHWHLIEAGDWKSTIFAATKAQIIVALEQQLAKESLAG